jgi:hypothetical protein
VTIENALISLVEELKRLGEATLFLGRAVESAVDSTAIRPTEELGHQFLEFDAAVRDANSAAGAARYVVEASIDIQRLRRYLTACMQALESALTRLDEQSGDGIRVLDDVRFEDEWHQDQWRKLMSELINWMGECRVRLSGSRQALTLVWEEIADRAGATNLSVSTTNVGLQLAGDRELNAGDRELNTEPSRSANG